MVVEELMAAILFPLYALAHVWLVLWSIRLYNRGRSLAMVLLIVILTGFFLANLILATGSLWGEGSWLETLNRLRWLIALAGWPGLMVVGYEMARRAGVAWAQLPAGRMAAGVVAVGVFILGLVTQYAGRDLHPACFQGTLRYAWGVPANQLCGGDPVVPGGELLWPAVLTGVVLLGMGVSVWQHSRSPWLVVGALLFTLGVTLPSGLVGPAVAPAAELLLGATLLQTEKWLVRNLNLYDFHADA